MKISISTKVAQSYLQVKQGFDAALFTKLSPAFPPVKLIRFDGSEKGDIVSLELNFLLFKQNWTSEIIEDKTTEDEFYFIDKGISLPFFLKDWEHKHRVIKHGSFSEIRDEIDYKAPFSILTILLYPILYLQFAYRIGVYKRVFS